MKDLDDRDQLADLEENGLFMQDGQKVTLSVNENPTTGYEWYVEESDETIFKYKQKYIQDDIGDCIGCTGIGGTKHFTITAENPGQATFLIEQKRDWERYPILSIEIQINVEPKPE